MKNIKNKYIQAQKNSPLHGGFSYIRIRFCVLAGTATVLALAPFLGMLYSSIVVLLFAIFLTEKRIRFELCNLECTQHHYQEMDRVYGESKDAKYCKRQVKFYQSLYNKKPSVKKSVVKQDKTKVTKQVVYPGSLNLALNK